MEIYYNTDSGTCTVSAQYQYQIIKGTYLLSMSRFSLFCQIFFPFFCGNRFLASWRDLVCKNFRFELPQAQLQASENFQKKIFLQKICFRGLQSHTLSQGVRPLNNRRLALNAQWESKPATIVKWAHTLAQDKTRTNTASERERHISGYTLVLRLRRRRKRSTKIQQKISLKREVTKWVFYEISEKKIFLNFQP